jgi:hypothetical protein
MIDNLLSHFQFCAVYRVGNKIKCQLSPRLFLLVRTLRIVIIHNAKMPKKQAPRRIDECDNAPLPRISLSSSLSSSTNARLSQPHTAKMHSHARTQITREKEEANSMSCELMCVAFATKQKEDVAAE